MEQAIIKKIKEEFERRQSVNPYYSLRGFARQLGVSVSLLSRVMNGKMPMTSNILKRLAVPLSLSPDEFEEYEVEINKRKNLQSSEKIWGLQSRQLGLEEFHLIQDWYNFAVLELVNLPDFHACEKWIAQKLRISQEDALMALERLVRLELIIQTENGKFEKANNYVSIMSSEFTTVAMKKRQKQVLQKAIDVIDMVDINFRDQSSITISLDSSMIPEIKQKIKAMRRSLANYISNNSKNKDKVYELSISFFPWSE